MDKKTKEIILQLRVQVRGDNMITVFTPTYNREKKLHLVYEALLKQDATLFEWLVVDDGSTDNTEQVVENWIAEKKITIRYIKQENAGKSMAFNRGVKEAKGEFFVCCDSDDRLKENVLTVIQEKYETIKDEDLIAGIGFISSKLNTNEVIGTKYPQDEMISNYYDIYHKYGVQGDKQLMFKTDILKQYPFPQYGNEKFVPEALVFLRIAKKYKILFCNVFGEEKEYQDDGYTSQYFSLVKRNPRGNMQYFLELYDYEKKMYNIYGYILFGIYAKYSLKEMLQLHPAKGKVLVLYMPTKIVSWMKGK